MHSFVQFIVASAVFSVASASPLKSMFTVNANVTKGYIKPGPKALANAYTKFGGTMPSEVAAAAAAASGSVVATPEEYDSEYLCPVKVGSDTLNLDFDTGSSDL